MQGYIIIALQQQDIVEQMTSAGGFGPKAEPELLSHLIPPREWDS